MYSNNTVNFQESTTILNACKKKKTGNLFKAPRKSKTMDSEAVFQATEANQMSSIQRVSGEVGISQSSVIRHLHDLDNSCE